MRRSTAQGPAGAISYIVWEGPAGTDSQPLLGLHPVNTGAEIWADIAALLSAERTVIAYDYRGHGELGDERSVRPRRLRGGWLRGPGSHWNRPRAFGWRIDWRSRSDRDACRCSKPRLKRGRVRGDHEDRARKDDFAAMANSLREMGVGPWFDKHGEGILGPKAKASVATELTRLAVGHGREVPLVTEVIWETFGKADSRPSVGRLVDRGRLLSWWSVRMIPHAHSRWPRNSQQPCTLPHRSFSTTSGTFPCWKTLNRWRPSSQNCAGTRRVALGDISRLIRCTVPLPTPHDQRRMELKVQDRNATDFAIQL